MAQQYQNEVKNMKSRKKPGVDSVLGEFDLMSDDLFGSLDININTLPCLTKPQKEKITAKFDVDLLKEIRSFAKKKGVSYTVLMNDALREVFINNQKT